MASDAMGLMACMRDAGAHFDSARETLVAAHFGDPAGEWQVVRGKAGLLVRSHRGVIAASGPDTLTWLQGMVTGDVRALAQGGPALYTCLADATGHVIADVAIAATPDGAYLDVPRLEASALVHLLDGYIISEDVTLEDFSSSTVVLSLQGPAAQAEAVRALFGHRAGVAAAADHSGEGGIDLYVPECDAAAVWTALVGWGAAPVGETAAEALRVEAGQPRWGSDFGWGTLAPEAGLPDGAISYAKGCYVGQEVVARIHARGHTNRGLAGVVFEPDAAVRPPAALALPTDEGREVGSVTSVAWSYGLGRHAGLATVRHEASETGTRLAVSGTGATAIITALPFAGARA